MEKSRSFGRAGPPIPPKRRVEARQAAPTPPPAQDPLAAELRAWKAERPRQPFPWRPFLLMASLCFGIGSLILPDGVNNAASWVMYALTAISFFLGLRRRRGKL